MNLEKLVRKNIWNLKPYSTARDEFDGEADVYLDANENPYNYPYNRYPDPLQRKLKEKISGIKGIAKEKIFLGNGSDEAIDIVPRIFCRPGIDNIVAIDPTYGMYKVAANTNDIDYRPVLLDGNFDFKAEDLLKVADEQTKIIFLCSPNNPSGNVLNRDEIYKTLQQFEGIVVLDEAYIDFSSQPSFLDELDNYPNLIVLQTFSKAWGSAGIRLGMAFASTDIIRLMNKVKYPYNINKPTQELMLKLLENRKQITDWVTILLEERDWLLKKLESLPVIEKIYPSDANFLLVKVSDADAIYSYLVKHSTIVRNRNTVSLCLNCLRITVGTREENEKLIVALESYKS